MPWTYHLQGPGRWSCVPPALTWHAVKCPCSSGQSRLRGHRTIQYESSISTAGCTVMIKCTVFTWFVSDWQDVVVGGQAGNWKHTHNILGFHYNIKFGFIASCCPTVNKCVCVCAHSYLFLKPSSHSESAEISFWPQGHSVSELWGQSWRSSGWDESSVDSSPSTTPARTERHTASHQRVCERVRVFQLISSGHLWKFSFN